MIILCFDTETTGLAFHPQARLSVQPRVTDFAAVLLDSKTNEFVETYEHLFNPEQPLSAEITKITGLTDADLKDQPLFKDKLSEIKALFAKADIMCAHNLSFDRHMLETELRHCNCTDFPWPRHQLCTVELNMEMWGMRPRLINLYEETFILEFDQKHRAMSDAMALAEVVQDKRYADLFEGIKS